MGEILAICPVCGKDGVRALHKPRMAKVSHLSDKDSRAKYYEKEKYTILEACANCNTGRHRLQQLFDGKNISTKTHKQRIKRLKKAGMPTQFSIK